MNAKQTEGKPEEGSAGREPWIQKEHSQVTQSHAVFINIWLEAQALCDDVRHPLAVWSGASVVHPRVVEQRL